VYHLSSPVLFCGRTSPGQTAAGADISLGRAYAAGSGPLS